MILNKLLKKTQFTSYADFIKNFRINIPARFNFAFDVVDETALHTPEKVAMVWCDDKGSEHIFTFGEMKIYSDKAANFFQSAGIPPHHFARASDSNTRSTSGCFSMNCKARSGSTLVLSQ